MFDALAEEEILPRTVTLLAGGETFDYPVLEVSAPVGHPGRLVTCSSPQQETIGVGSRR